MTTASEQATITLEYNLYDLPSAQHKAGLAGLLFLIQTLKERGVSPLPEVIGQTPISVRLSLSESSLMSLFQEVYAACLVENPSKQLRKDKKTKENIEPLRTETRAIPNTNKTEKIYFYQDVRPKGSFMADYLPGGKNSPWLKLWQDMLWGTLRGIPATRGIYEEQLDGKPCSEAHKFWNQLTKAQKPKQSQLTGPVASSVFIGAQDVNAEQVPFEGLVAQNLLLHFWNLTTLVYVAQRFKVEDERIKSEYAGYVLAIPEIAHLDDFLEAYIPVIQNLSEEKHFKHPKDALISLPEEAGMEYLYHLAKAGFLEQKGKKLKRLISAIELHHLEKQGNNIKILTSDKVIPRSRWFREYENLRQRLRNPLFKARCLKNLLQGHPWYQGFDIIFSVNSGQIFCYSHEKPQYTFFGLDARHRFEILINELKQKEAIDPKMPELAQDQLARSVYRLIRAFAQFRTESKSGQHYENFQHHKDEKGRTIYPKEYRDSREKVCSDAFLAMRGRREADFIEYFTGTICSVPHYLPEDDFVRVSQALLNDWETIKTLSMLALSAHSYLGSAKKEDKEGE